MNSVIIPHAVKVQVQNQSSGVEEVILHRFNKMTCQISTEQQQKPSAANHLKHLWKRNSCLVTAPLNHCGSSSTWAATWVWLGPCAVDLQKRFTRLLCSPCSNYMKNLHYGYALKVHDWITLHWITVTNVYMNVMNYECIYEHVFPHFVKISEGEKKLAGPINNLSMK